MNDETNPGKPLLKVVPDEQRDTGRQRTLKGGDIICEGDTSPLACTIRDLSDTGAKLELDSDAVLPERFALHFHDGRKWLCEVMWQTGTALGVRFIGVPGAPETAAEQGDVKRLLLERISEIERQLDALRTEIMVHFKE